MNPVSKNSPSIDEVNPISKEHHVDVPSASRTPSSQAPPLNLPCQDLLDEGRREEYLKICLPLYKASRKGDWNKAKDILDERKELVRFSITNNCETALHVAVSRRKTEFVKNLLSLMEKEDLELRDNCGYTALCIAVRNRDVEMARILLDENKALIDIPTSLGMIPLHMAASYNWGQKMVKFLYEKSQSLEGEYWTPESRSSFLLTCVEAEYFDVALEVLEDRPEQLALSGGGVLKLLAQKTKAFKPILKVYLSCGLYLVLRGWMQMFIPFIKFPALPLLRSILENIAKLPRPEVYDLMRGPADPIDKEKTATNRIDTLKKYSSRVLFLAAEVGNTVFIVEIIRQYPELLKDVNDVNQSIFHVAISHRHMKLYRLLHEIGSIEDHIITLEDKNGNNMLHLAGIFTESAKSNRYGTESIEISWLRLTLRLLIIQTGPLERMQRELSCYEEVKNTLPISLRKKKNAAGMTPHQEFIKDHKDLFRHCERFIKDTCSQLIVVAALLATISFAAMITFPGGYNQENGYPVLRWNEFFPWFMIYNSTAFFSATVSMLLTLYLVTSSYSEDKFSFMPIAIILQLTLLAFYFSLAATTTAFIHILYLLFEESLPMLEIVSEGMLTLLLYPCCFGIMGLIAANIFYCRIESQDLPSTRSHDQELFQNI